MADNVITEWFIDGAWTSNAGGVDLDERVRKNPGVRITRSVSDQQSQPTPATSEFEVNNADGIFSNRNPLSPLFRKIPRYTQVRHRIPTVAGSRDAYILSLRPDQAGSCSTTDKAALEITGDIDIRFEITPDTWSPLQGYAICGKYNITGNNRAWLVWLDYTQQFVFRWSEDGASILQADFGAWPYGEGRQCVRITMDVNNGAAGKTVVLYRSDSMSGPWETISTVTAAGTTSIYGSGTAPLELCDVDSGSPISNQTMMYGKMHAFELRNGINGTVVADLSVKEKDVNATSWADAYGNTWTLTGTTRVGSDRIRHTGEMDSVQYDWDETQRDVWLPLGALGPLNRMQEAGTPVESPLTRVFRSYPNNAGYWRLEEQPGATKAIGEGTSINTSLLSGCSFSGSSPAGLPGSGGSLRLDETDASMWLGTAGRVGTGENSVVFCFKLSSLPAGGRTLLTLTGNGTVRRWDVRVSNTGYGLDGYNVSNTAVITKGVLFGTGADPTQSWIMMQVTLTQEGGNVRVSSRWTGIGTGSPWYAYNLTGDTYAGTCGIIGQIQAVAYDPAFVGAEFAHVVNTRDVYPVNTTDQVFRRSAEAWDGEQAGARALRVAGESGLDLEIYGDPADTEPMGPQAIDTPFNILNECAKVDNAQLFDVRDRFAIGFRTRIDMCNRIDENRDVDYEASYFSKVPRPVEDSRYTRNIFTASRPNGASGQYTLTTGPYSKAEPPNGIGPRLGSDTYNAYTDDQIQRIAEYQVFLRTQDELRIPSLSFELNRSQLAEPLALRERIIAAIPGDWFRFVFIPTFVDYDTGKYMIVLGYSEEFNGDLWEISFNVATADAWRIPVVQFAFLADDGTTTLKTSLTTTGTSNTLVTPITSRPWLYDTHPNWRPGGIQVYLGGELCQFTSIGTPSIVGSNYEQTVTITRSLNGIVKAQNAGEVAETTEVFFLGLG